MRPEGWDPLEGIACWVGMGSVSSANEVGQAQKNCHMIRIHGITHAQYFHEIWGGARGSFSARVSPGNCSLAVKNFTGHSSLQS